MNEFERTTSTLESAGAAMQHGYQTAREEALRVTAQVEQFIRKNPVAAAFAAAGIGWIVGRFLSGRGRGRHALNTPKGNA